MSQDSGEQLSVLELEHIRSTADNVLENWTNLTILFELPEVPDTVEEEDLPSYDIDAIVIAGDNHFNSMTDLSAKSPQNQTN